PAIQSAWYCERRQIQELRRISIVIVNGRHYIRPAKTFSATVVVAFEIVVQRERMPAQEGQHSAKGPPRTKLSECLPRRNIIGRGQYEAVARIEIRVTSVAVGIRAVIRLRGIRHVILTVA